MYARREGKPKAQKHKQFLKWALANINPDGTFFDYTPTTVPMLMALSTFPHQKELITKGITTIESFQEKTTKGHLLQTPGEASIGETFYVANALLDVGFAPDHEVIKKAEKYLNDHQLKTGGWGFSKNSIHFADSDDTSNAMYLMIRLDQARGKEIRPEVYKALTWLLTLQNIDGGFGTWERTNSRFIGNLINRFANKKGLVMSESVFEHTARIVVSLSYLRHTNQEAALAYKKAYKWLLKQQKKDGSFAGTWFINYMFSTSMALTALATDHTDRGEAAILKGIKYLVRNQSLSGGFGESPDSFLKGEAVHLKESSWAQTGLIVSQLHTMNTMNSCKYKTELKGLLDSSFLYLRDEKDSWTRNVDPNWTAVTFPKVEYLIYPYIQKMAPWQAYNMYLNTTCQ
jgi:squalene cyclase